MAYLTQVTADALEWVRVELDSSLGRIGQLVEGYLENPQEKIPLQRALSELRQVRGTLSMIQCFGAAILAEEACRVLRDLTEGHIEQAEGAFESVLGAVLQLSDYIDLLGQGTADSALVFQLLINELRVARGADVLNEVDLFVRQTAQQRPRAELPDLSGREPAAALAASQRYYPAFQVALLQWLQNQDAELNLRRLGTIAEQLQARATEPDVYELWWLFAALVEGVLIGGIEATAPVKRLAGQTSQVLKTQAVASEENAILVPPELLVRLLCHIQRSAHPGRRQSAVQASYSLAGLLPDEATLASIRRRLRGPNSELVGKLSEALKEDLGAVRDSIDLLVRAGDRAPGDVDELLELCMRISNTLAMLGLNRLQRRLLTQMETLDRIRRTGSANEGEWMAVATALVEIEQRLDHALSQQLHGGADADVHTDTDAAEDTDEDDGDVALDLQTGAAAFFRESLVNVARVKELFQTCLQTGDDNQLAACDRLLNEVAAGLAVIGKPKGADGFARLRLALTKARSRLVRDPALRDAFADVVAAQEWYLEALGGAHGRNVADPASVVPYLDRFEKALDQVPDSDEPIAEPQPQEPVPSAGTDDIEPEFRDIFLEEAAEVQAELERRVPSWSMQPDDRDSLAVVRRAFHTLKGSGRMVGATAVGDFGWALEHMLNQCLEGSLQVSSEVVAAVNEAVSLLPDLIETFREDGVPDPRVRALMETADAIARDEGAAADTEAEDGEPAEVAAAPDAELVQIFHKDVYARLRVVESFVDDQSEECPDLATVTRALHTIHGSAESAHADGIAEVTGALEDSLKAMASSGNSVSSQAREVMRSWLDFVHQALDGLGSDASPALDTAPILMQIEALERTLPRHGRELEAEQEKIRNFTEEALNLLEQCESHLDGWYRVPDDSHHPEAIADTMDALADRAMRTGIPVFVEVCRTVAGRIWTTLDDMEDSNDPALIHILHQVLDGLYDFLDRLRFGEHLTDADSIIALLHPESEQPDEHELAASQGEVPVESGADPAEDSRLDADAGGGQWETPAVAEEGADGREPAAPSEPEPGPDSDPEQDRWAEAESEPEPRGEPVPLTPVADAELMAIFAEEANELLEAIDRAVSAWQTHLDQTEATSDLQRLLHTLKGSARMARVPRIGDASHELETYISAVDQRRGPASAESVAVVRHAVDVIQGMAERVAAGERPAPADELIALLRAARSTIVRGEDPSIEQLRATPVQAAAEDGEATVDESAVDAVSPGPADTGETIVAADDRDDDAEDAEEEQPVAGDGARAPADASTTWAAQLFWQPHEDQGLARRQSEEVARVAVENLDQMLNEGGEISIFRSRLERENTALRFQLDEMQQLIARIGEQLRKLNLETETAILARHQGQRDSASLEDRYGGEFDPLELDRYTHAQELSRALSEGLDDLSSLYGLMEQSVHESDSLLLQQARVNTSLQQRLMGTLMVPFSRQASRLQRVVRQTAAEYQRDVRLQVRGESHELDRNVLQRMIAPLEHLLRNAVVHGIEAPEQRARAGKPENGLIDLQLWRDGSQLVIELRDDGRGIDLVAIRKKAESRRMLTPGQAVSDEVLAGLIFERGFTTADRLTQSAGRGVGMDVVNAEIKQLGGTIQMDSVPGQGARFEIRLPLSLAISQTLLVRTGDESFAIPLRSIEGITRIERTELQTLFEDEYARFSYGGYSYVPGYLGDLVGLPRPDPAGLPEHVSLLLVRAGDQRSAIAVDAAIGGREVVMKPVGPQVSTVAGVNGATILADGQVVLILEVGALLAEQARHRLSSTEPATPRDDSRPLVLVVDDSITVRRVSERLLTRNGYRVALARDGMDALAKLQVEPPAVVLLDIEMPRLDGFEVATYVRNAERLSDVPIIMLTSRSGEKHRQRARQIGVNRYLIKPYQEDGLLREIRTLIGESAVAAEPT